MGDAEIGSYFHLTPEVIDIIESGMSVDLPKQHITGNLHDSSMFSAAVKDESGSRACVNPGLSAPIVSTPIVSPPASALRSTPIPGDIAGGYTACKHGFTPECTFCWNERRRLNGQSTVDTAEPYRPLATGSSRADKIRAVAQQAHDNGDCVCCLPDEMVEFERAKQTTITISREDAEAMADFFTDPSERFLLGRLALSCQAALEGE